MLGPGLSPSESERVFQETLSAFPPDLVLDGLLYEADALEDVGDVVDSSLLHM